MGQIWAAGNLETWAADLSENQREGGEICVRLLMLLLVWSQVSSVSSWKNSWTWSGRNQDKLEVASTSDFYLPSSHPNNLQSIMTVTSFLLSITHTIFSLDNLFHLSTAKILRNRALAYRFLHFNTTIVHLRKIGIYIVLFNHILFLSKLIAKPSNYLT